MAEKLNWAAVRELRRRRREDKVTQGQLARDYGISVIQVGRILRNESWHEPLSANSPPSSLEKEDSLRRLLLVQQTVEAESGRPPTPFVQPPPKPEDQGLNILERAKQAIRARSGAGMLQELSSTEPSSTIQTERNPNESRNDLPGGE